MTSTFTLRLTPEERNIVESYSKINSISIGDAFKRALFEKIEDEYDVAIYEEAYNEYVKDGKKSAPIAELWKECGI